MAPLKQLFEPFEEWGTRFIHKLQSDRFFSARLQLIALYFIGGSSIYLFLSWFLGAIIRKQLYAVVLVQSGPAAEQAIALFETQSLLLRFTVLTFFALFAFFITEFALRPIKKAAELQQRFIGIVSHELRTPLTVMRNASEVALRQADALTKERAVRVITENLEEIDRLSNTLQFLLTFSDLKNRNRPADLRPVSLVTVVERVVALIEKENDSAEVMLSYVPDGHSYLVRGNQIALEGLLANLIANALRYSPAAEKVTIALAQGKSGTILSVSDMGRGIAKKDLPYIFEPFYRGEEGIVEQRMGGAGLGLSIVKEIADLHHAALGVETGMGKGSTFTVTFPAFKTVIHKTGRLTSLDMRTHAVH